MKVGEPLYSEWASLNVKSVIVDVYMYFKFSFKKEEGSRCGGSTTCFCM